MQDTFPQFKSLLIKFTYRKVPFWARLFQKLGLFLRVGKIVKISEYKTNVFVNTGKTSLLKRMAGLNYGEITYLALGDNTAAPSASDTKLGNELFRKAVTQKSAGGLTFYSKTFISSTEGNYTYKEAGLFGDDATGTKDSGTLFTRIAIDETKTSGQSATVEYNVIAV